jgi:hypothetical protein
VSDDMSVCPECGGTEGWDCAKPRTKDCEMLLRCRSCKKEFFEGEIHSMCLF